MGISTLFSESEPTRAQIDAHAGPVVLEFGTPWCNHCMAAQPIIASAFANHLQVGHIKIEDGPGRTLGRSFHVKLWPTLIFMHQGKEISRLVRPSDSSIIKRALAQIDAQE